jgi:class 3 adenylate cyclase/predicted ATPase
MHWTLSSLRPIICSNLWGPPMDVGAWLRGLGLGQYEGAFRDSEIEADTLPELTETDLEKLGLPLGPRKRILRAIQNLGEADQASGAAHLARPIPAKDTAERRQLTVMFCDLVGSTAISARLDPEDLSSVIGAFQKACVSAVTAFGGSIAKYMGDGALVYFGYPEAHEDDAERAIRAGLALLDTVAAIRLPLPVRPQVRVGIATGLVVVGELIGEGGAQERVAVGETLNLAARIQAAASPDSVVVGELTRRLAGVAFDYDDLGPHELKGIPAAVRLWRVTGESATRGRFDSRTARGLTPLVGRTEEIGLLRRRWDYAKEGDGQLVLLSAPAGFGKSRLTLSFREDLDDSSVTCLQYFGSPFHVNSPFHPFIRQLERAAGIVRTDTAVEKLCKLEGILEGSAENIIEDVPLLAALLSIPFEERYPRLQITELVQKERTLELLEEQLALLSRRGPVLFIFEDAHWIDPSSLELMNSAIRRVANLPVMIVVTYRPEFSPPWLDLGHATVLKLNQLGRSQVADLVHNAAGGKTLPEAITEQIAFKSQGVPLFIEEITRSILESGDLEDFGNRYALRQSIREFTIPATLQDSLIARLDRLGSAKELVLTASIIGREFSYELIEALSTVSHETLLADLERLVQSDLLEQRGTPPRSRYIFKHALILDAASQSVLKARKRELHQRVAEVFTSRFPEVVETEPELLAHHYTEASVVDLALACWRRAAERAAARLAYVEALGHVDKAMKLVAALPEGRERDEWELGFLVIEGPSRMALDGWDSPPAKRLYEAARAVAERLGRPAELFRSVWGLWMGAHSSGQHVLAHELYREVFEILKRTDDPEYVVQAHHAGSSQMVAEGVPRAALAHVEKLLTSYRMDVHGNLALMYGAHDPRCCAHCTGALGLLMLGRLDQAQAESAKAVELSELLGHQPSIAHTQMFRAELCIILNHSEAAEAHLSNCISLSKKYSLAAYLNVADLMQGSVLALRGEVEAGIRQAESALVTLMSVPSRRFHLPIRIAIVGQAKMAGGDIEGALALFDTALEAASSTGERWYEPELLRLKAEMLLARSGQHAAAAEHCLTAAIALAQKQETKFWELRAATALAVLWNRQGRRVEARDLLEPVFGWFTEGLGSVELRNAAALLSELRPF